MMSIHHRVHHYFFLFVVWIVVFFFVFFLSTLLIRASRIANFAFIVLSCCSLAMASMALLKPPKLRRPNTHCVFDVFFFSRTEASCSCKAFCLRARSYSSGFSYVQCSSSFLLLLKVVAFVVVVVVVVLAVVNDVVVVAFSSSLVFFSCARCMNFNPFSLELNLMFPIVFTSSFDVAAMVSMISALIRVACNQQKPRKQMWRQQHTGRGREKKKVRITKKKIFTQRFLSLSPRGRARRIKKKRDKLLVKSVVNS